MDEWMDGWMDGWKDGCIDGWVDAWMYGVGGVGGLTYGCTEGELDEFRNRAKWTPTITCS